MSAATAPQSTAERRGDKADRLALGVVLERRRIAHPWQEFAWRPVAILPSAPPVREPRLLRQGADWAWYHMATLDLELYPVESAGYQTNLRQAHPVIYALWHHPNEDPEGWPGVFHVTASPYESQGYLDGSDIVIEGMPMPESVRLWVEDFVNRYPPLTADEEADETRSCKPASSVAEENEIG